MIYELKYRWYRSGKAIASYSDSLDTALAKVQSVKDGRGIVISLREYEFLRQIELDAPARGGFSAGFSNGFTTGGAS